jgi:hypothetical protein
VEISKLACAEMSNSQTFCDGNGDVSIRTSDLLIIFGNAYCILFNPHMCENVIIYDSLEAKVPDSDQPRVR